MVMLAHLLISCGEIEDFAPIRPREPTAPLSTPEGARALFFMSSPLVVPWLFVSGPEELLSLSTSNCFLFL
jgi:hypothetical protein